jgi:putative flippase GtrA
MRVLRYLVSGLINVGLTYVLYLVLLRWLSFAVSYTVAFTVGVWISYLLNRSFVFRAAGGRHALLLFIAVYLVQYLLGLTITTLLVPAVGPELAPVGAVAVIVPLSYVLTRRIFAQS